MTRFLLTFPNPKMRDSIVSDIIKEASTKNTFYAFDFDHHATVKSTSCPSMLQSMKV